MGEDGLLLIRQLRARYDVAILHFSKDGIQKKYLKRQVDYTDANKDGTKGVYIYYILRPGFVYEVLEPVTWKTNIKYFCIVQNGELIKSCNLEGFECLK